MSTDNATGVTARHPTGAMIGRFQGWHTGHRTLFEAILARVGHVTIMVRDTHLTSPKDPFDFQTVRRMIDDDLAHTYSEKYTIMLVPNITGVYYGRDVGYEVAQLKLPDAVEAMSATEFRKAMKNG